MNQALFLLASLAAVLALALIAKLLGLGATPKLESAEQAIAEARAHHFAAVDAVIEGDRALVTDAAGKRMTLRPHGNHFVLTDA